MTGQVIMHPGHGKQYRVNSTVPKKRRYEPKGTKGVKSKMKRKRVVVRVRYQPKVGSKTMSVERKTSKAVEISQHNDLSIHTVPDIIIGYKVAKYKSLGNFHYMDSYQFIQNKTQGLQGVDNLGSIMTRDIIVGNIAAVATNRFDRERLADDLYLMNPFSNLPGNAYITGPGNPSQDRILLKNIHLNLEILSMENIPQMVDILIITPKFDCASDCINTWGQALTDLALGQGANTPAALRATLTATSGKQSLNQYGAVPNSNRLFRKMYDVVHCKSVVLQPGDQYNIRYNFVYNKVMMKNMFLANVRGEPYLKGWTVSVLAITKGGLVGMTNAVGTGASEVAHGTVKVGYALNWKYNLCALPTTRIESARIYEGLLVGDTTEKQQKLDDTDQNKELAQS